MLIEFDTSVGTIRGELVESELDTWKVRLDDENTRKLASRYFGLSGVWANTLSGWLEVSDEFGGNSEYKYRIV